MTGMDERPANPAMTATSEHHYTCPWKGTAALTACRSSCLRTHCTGKATEPAPDHEFTPDVCERIIHSALEAGDVKAVHAALILMAPQDPDRAQRLVDTLKLGIALATPLSARKGVGTGAGGDDDPASTEATLWVNRSVDCPEAPAQAHPLSEREAQR